MTESVTSGNGEKINGIFEKNVRNSYALDFPHYSHDEGQKEVDIKKSMILIETSFRNSFKTFKLVNFFSIYFLFFAVCVTYFYAAVATDNAATHPATMRSEVILTLTKWNRCQPACNSRDRK